MNWTLWVGKGWGWLTRYTLVKRDTLPHRRKRMTCLVCGKDVAITSTGLWKHKCPNKSEA